MKITKRQLKRIIHEELAREGFGEPTGAMVPVKGYDPHEMMQKVTDFDNAFQEMWVGAPFRSAGVRMAMEDLRKALLDLGNGMREELKQIEMLGD